MLDRVLKAAYLVGLAAMFAVRLVSVRRARRGTSPNERRFGGALAEAPLHFLTFIGMQVMPALYLLTDRLGFADYRLPRWIRVAMGVIGAPVFAAATWLLYRSHADLDRNWSPTLQGNAPRTLVTEGVYATARHPMYGAHLLWGVAQALLLHNWIAGPAFFLSQIPLYLYRVPREEAMLEEQFGEEYRSYARCTHRFLPRPTT